MIKSPLVPAFIEGQDHSEGYTNFNLPIGQRKYGIIDQTKAGAIRDCVLYNSDGDWRINFTGLQGINPNVGRLGFWVNIHNMDPSPESTSWFDIDYSNTLRVGPTDGLQAITIEVLDRISYTLFDSGFPRNLSWTFIEYSYDVPNGEYSLFMNGVRVAHVENGTTTPFSQENKFVIYAACGTADFWWENIFITNNPDKNLYSIRHLLKYNNDPEIVFFWRCVGGGEVRSAPEFDHPIDFVNGAQGTNYSWPLEETLTEDSPEELDQPTTRIDIDNQPPMLSSVTIPIINEEWININGYDVPPFDMNHGRIGYWIKTSNSSSEDVAFAISLGRRGLTTESIGLCIQQCKARLIKNTETLSEEFIDIPSDEWVFVELGWDSLLGTWALYLNSQETSFTMEPYTYSEANQIMILATSLDDSYFEFSNVMASKDSTRNLYALRNLTENPRIPFDYGTVKNPNIARLGRYSDNCTMRISGAPIDVSMKDVSISTQDCYIRIRNTNSIYVDLKDDHVISLNPTLKSTSIISSDIKDVTVETYPANISKSSKILIDLQDKNIQVYEPTLRIDEDIEIAVDREICWVSQYPATISTSTTLVANRKDKNISTYRPKLVIVNIDDLLIKVDMKDIQTETYNSSLSVSDVMETDRKDKNIQTYNPTLNMSKDIDLLVNIKNTQIATSSASLHINNDIGVSVDREDKNIQTYSATLNIQSSKIIDVDMKDKNIQTYNPRVTIVAAGEVIMWWRTDHD
jgi:hypothetical protein